MNTRRIEMIGQIEPTDGEAHRVFIIDFEVAANAAIEGKKARIAQAVGVGFAHVFLRGINDKIGRTATDFEQR